MEIKCFLEKKVKFRQSNWNFTLQYGMFSLNMNEILNQTNEQICLGSKNNDPW